ncbi:pyridoxamine 5'-phosphate oxidase family protein [Micromonospora echinofusca]|uniref:Pyridoxamine 5'-phosphate oxidase n=1 Tax=Micromonospora echinofusca TaxID=47858 RepID=A0ABS3VTD7_MICEH|nr:pyridoxamine 5'-phosphate oxidase family protein [Micromonospora echinofusca]MBO4207633.1 pyridoxamine 5'-phosphate oxidase [Micromonospora echinofusca]
MATWSEFAADEPRLADGIRHLMQQYGPGLGYLATVRADGGPRVHPVSPVITEEGLFCFVIDSPKRRDLERDGRYALHSFPPEESDDEAYVAGRARPVTDPARVARVADRAHAARQVDWRLFEFTIDVAMLARRGGGGGPASQSRPDVQVWLDPTGAGGACNGSTAPPSVRPGRRGRHARRTPVETPVPVAVPETPVPAP